MGKRKFITLFLFDYVKTKMGKRKFITLFLFDYVKTKMGKRKFITLFLVSFVGCQSKIGNKLLFLFSFLTFQMGKGNTGRHLDSVDLSVIKWLTWRHKHVSSPGADTGFFGGARTPPPPTAVCNIFFIFKPTDVNFPLPFKFHCRIQST